MNIQAKWISTCEKETPRGRTWVKLDNLSVGWCKVTDENAHHVEWFLEFDCYTFPPPPSKKSSPWLGGY
jgi:hypothetical protein